MFPPYFVLITEDQQSHEISCLVLRAALRLLLLLSIRLKRYVYVFRAPGTSTCGCMYQPGDIIQ